MSEFRDKIKAYVDERWFVPCKDDLAWVYYAGINTAQEMAKRKLSPAEWMPIFLLYDGQKRGQAWKLEGLFLVKRSEGVGAVARGLEVTACPSAIMLASWFDNAGDDNLTVKPPYHGLNDCAHYVTQSLMAGGIDVRTTGVTELMNKLRHLPDTKTLAYTVDAPTAKRILQTDLMKVGDVIIFSKNGHHAHSVVAMGNAKITMHTWANHPNHPTLKGEWEPSASEDHPQVTLIHFGRDDAIASAGSWLPGWWEVTWRGTPYYYKFDAKGGVAYTKRKPAGPNAPLGAADGRGYWFESPFEIKVCWTSTGSLEQFKYGTPLRSGFMTGTWNGGDRLDAVKLTG